MLKGLYKPMNVATTVFHLGAASAVALASHSLASRRWIPFVATAATAAITTGLVKFVIPLVKTRFVPYESVHRYSPKLGQMMRTLSHKAGFGDEDLPVYAIKPSAEDKPSGGGLLSILNKIPNAAVITDLQVRPSIIVSDPLLKLLDDGEEYAVLAHEFSHAAAHHGQIGLLQSTVSATGKLANGLTKIVAIYDAGWRAFVGALIAHELIKRSVMGTADDGYLLNADKKKLSYQDRYRQKSLEKLKDTLSIPTVVFILNYSNPQYAKLYIFTKLLSATSKVLEGTISRSKEYQADRGSVLLGANPLDLITALRKITIVMEQSTAAFTGKSEPVEKGWLEESWKKLTSTHPTTERRIERLSGIARKSGYSEAQINCAAKADIYISDTHNIPYEVVLEMSRI